MFDLPKTTEINRVIHKNMFDNFTNSKQKKAFANKILRITWVNKIAFDTVNLQGINIEEIQIFKIELKEKIFIEDIISIIEKSIPYHIIFWIEFGDEFYISTSVKRRHLKNENSFVIEYIFTSDWQLISDNVFRIELKNTLDSVFKSFCDQLKSIKTDAESIKELVEKQKKNDVILKKIEKIKSQMEHCKQFNKKVSLNLKLKELQSLL